MRMLELSVEKPDCVSTAVGNDNIMLADDIGEPILCYVIPLVVICQTMM